MRNDHSIKNTLTELVSVQNRYQFELKFTYPLVQTDNVNQYQVDTFFFLPKELAIDAQSYSSLDFYSDMSREIRFKTPKMRLDNLADKKESPIKKLQNSIDSLIAEPTMENISIYEERVKMFCSIMKSALRDEAESMIQNAPQENIPALIHDYLERTRTIVRRFRALEPKLEKAVGLDPRRIMLFHLADEFLSLTVNGYRYDIFQKVQEDQLVLPDKLKEEIVSELSAEIEYRKEAHYPSIPHQDSDNEEMVYRVEALNKLVASVLNLRSETRQDGVFIQNFVFAMAAGLAMAFAVLVTFATTRITQNFTLTFFTTAIIAYMFKDRIKEVARGYFYSKIKPMIFDFKTDITNSMGRKVGVCRESFSFIKPIQVPGNILYLRKRNYFDELEFGDLKENIIFSRKQINLYSDSCQHVFNDFDVNGVVDIVHFNVRNFLMRMNNPNMVLFMPNSENSITKIKGKRVYHINVVQRYSIAEKQDEYRRFRLVLTRNGIRRIEMIPIPPQAPFF